MASEMASERVPDPIAVVVPVAPSPTPEPVHVLRRVTRTERREPIRVLVRVIGRENSEPVSRPALVNKKAASVSNTEAAKEAGRGTTALPD